MNAPGSGRVRLRLVGDSFGLPTSADARSNEAWPAQVAETLGTWQVQSDFCAYRRFVEIPDLLKGTDADIVIVQAGVVDCFPRPLPRGISSSSNLGARMLRRCVRSVRTTWMRHIFRTTWTSPSELDAAVDAFGARGQTTALGLVTAVPPLPRWSAGTPLAHDAVLAFNDCLRALAARLENAFVIDLYLELVARGYLRFLRRADGHLNAAGHGVLASLVLAALSERAPGRRGPSDAGVKPDSRLDLPLPIGART